MSNETTSPADAGRGLSEGLGVVRQRSQEGNFEDFVPRCRVVHEPDGAWLLMQCPKFGVCRVPVSRLPAHDDPQRGRVWQWDGDELAPTIRPSVGCDDAPRCGQHRVITEGVW